MAKRLGQHQAPSSAWIRPERRLAIYIRDGFRCVACFADLRFVKAQDVTLDHLLSKSEYAALDAQTRVVFGSVHASHNLVTCCRSCNSARRDTEWTTFYNKNAQARVLAAKELPVPVALAKAIICGEIVDPRSEQYENDNNDVGAA